ncbi:MAG: lactate racemase domain-containing protein [Clostridiales bacterium]|nr:lactate racemase domain-containing protein [Clostridiales bacterium]
MNTMQVWKAKLRFNGQKLEDIAGSVRRELESAGLNIAEGAEIAVATGSRGIANIPLIIKTVCDFIKAKGGKPFIVPAMGSHGGATAEGQAAILAEYGISESTVGAPLRSSMEVVEIDHTGLPNRVYMDRNAWEADGVILVNRIKPHTDFIGEIESGLVKMSVIGLGKHKLAMEIHSFNAWGLANLLIPTAERIWEQNKILLGLAVLENAYDQTALVRALKPGVIVEEEKKLLQTARASMPALPADQIDILVVDRIGKDISGPGMDTNIIGRMLIEGMEDRPRPKIGHIIIDDLTEAAHGNACGFGLADFMTRKLFDKIDFQATYENILTSTFIQRGKLPMIADNALQAMDWSFRAFGRLDPAQARIMRIRNTLHLDEIYLSSALVKELSGAANIEIDREPRLLFQEDGTLTAF